MKKITELKAILEDIELQSADISTINEVISKAKTRIDEVTGEPHPEDDETMLEKLREVSTHLGNALAALSEVQRQSKDGK